MVTVLCANPLNLHEPDPDFALEAGLAETYELLSFERLTGGDSARCAPAITRRERPTVAVYRGWMLKPSQYGELYRVLEKRNLLLINTPEQYRACHYLPESYPHIASSTAATVWMRVPGAVDWEEVRTCLDAFGAGPVVVKDYVKSRKHEWSEACYIPNASDWPAARRVVARFVELQGDDLAEGLVFREYRRLRSIGTHPVSGMPLGLEYRTFYLDGQPVLTVPYWEEVAYRLEEPVVAPIVGLDSRFYTVDRAMQANGEWMVVEVGDGQVSGLFAEGPLRQLHAALNQVQR